MKLLLYVLPEKILSEHLPIYYVEALYSTYSYGLSFAVLPNLPQLKYSTVYEFENFSVTQILREINFGGLKDVVFVILGDLNLVFLVIFSFQKVQ